MISDNNGLAALAEALASVAIGPDEYDEPNDYYAACAAAVLAIVDGEKKYIETESNICPICHNVIIKEAHGGLHPSSGDHDSGLHVIDTYGEK